MTNGCELPGGPSTPERDYLRPPVGAGPCASRSGPAVLDELRAFRPRSLGPSTSRSARDGVSAPSSDAGHGPRVEPGPSSSWRRSASTRGPHRARCGDPDRDRLDVVVILVALSTAGWLLPRTLRHHPKLVAWVVSTSLDRSTVVTGLAVPRLTVQIGRIPAGAARPHRARAAVANGRPPPMAAGLLDPFGHLSRDRNATVLTRRA